MGNCSFVDSNQDAHMQLLSICLLFFLGLWSLCVEQRYFVSCSLKLQAMLFWTCFAVCYALCLVLNVCVLFPPPWCATALLKEVKKKQ